MASRVIRPASTNAVPLVMSPSQTGLSPRSVGQNMSGATGGIQAHALQMNLTQHYREAV